MRYKLGVDIGGTFTDFSLVDESGNIALWKEATTPANRALAVEQGLVNLAKAKGLSLEDFLESIELFVHGSTIATNTVIQRNGPKTALICSEGFRDVLHFRDGFKPDRYNISLLRAPDFVPRHLRIPISERINYRGDVLTPLDEASVRAACKRLREQEVESVAVALLWSVVNSSHEQRVKEIIAAECPGLPIVLSSDVLPMIREWERTCCAVLSAYILPRISQYMLELEGFLHDHNFRHPLLIMQLNGGCSTVENVLKRPIYALASGPAAGPTAGLNCFAPGTAANIIAMDMGGTSFDVCLVRGGQPAITTELRVADTPVGAAAVDVHSIGAGGGSIAWIDKGGALQVGPDSAGAEPGPSCYGLGGTEPTVTDANVVLGYINPDFFLGGRRRIDPNLSHRAIVEKIAKPLGLSVEEAAYGIFRIVNSNMVNAIKVVSIERGIDPRGYTFVVGGGAGAIHAGMLAPELGIKKAIVPRYAGVFCSYGMVVSDVRHDYMRVGPTNTEALDLAKINRIYEEMEAQAGSELHREGFSLDAISFARSADAKYPNQIHELTIPIPSNGPLATAHVREIARAFHALHERMFTYNIEESSVDVFHWRLTAVARTHHFEAKEQKASRISAATAKKGKRPVYFGDSKQYQPTDIYDGSKLLPEMKIEGPAVVEQENTTVALFGGQSLTVSGVGDYHLQIR
jgi:N-methylhydantoinase A